MLIFPGLVLGVTFTKLTILEKFNRMVSIVFTTAVMMVHIPMAGLKLTHVSDPQRTTKRIQKIICSYLLLTKKHIPTLFILTFILPSLIYQGWIRMG